MARLLARKSSSALAPAGVTDRERLVAQAVTFLQQQEVLAAQIALRHAVARPQGMMCRQRQREHVVEQRQFLDLGLVERQGQDQQIERACQQLAGEHRSLGLAQAQLQLGKDVVELRQDARQQIGADRRNDADAKRSTQHLGVPAREIGQILDGPDDGAGPAGDLAAGGCQKRAAARPLDQWRAESDLQLLDLHAEGRLGDVAAGRRLPEVLGFSQGDEVPELAQRGFQR